MKNNRSDDGWRGRDPDREKLWRDTLKQFAAGGQSVREFCAARRLKETAFYFWRAEIQRRDGQARARMQRSTPSFPSAAFLATRHSPLATRSTPSFPAAAFLATRHSQLPPRHFSPLATRNSFLAGWWVGSSLGRGRMGRVSLHPPVLRPCVSAATAQRRRGLDKSCPAPYSSHS